MTYDSKIKLIAFIACFGALQTFGQTMKSKTDKGEQPQPSVNADLRKLLEVCLECARDPACVPMSVDVEVLIKSAQKDLTSLDEGERIGRNKAYFRSIEAWALIPWNEGPEEETCEFWKRVKNKGLPYARRDILREILKRGSIKNREEYDLATDSLVGGVQAGRITPKENERLSEMIGTFEKTHSD